MKKCTKCCIEKPRSDFGVDRKNKDGLFYWCKPCACASTREWYQRNAERIKARERSRYWSDPEKFRAHTRANRERNREAVKRWRARNHEKVVDDVRRRQARLKGATELEPVDRRKVYERDNGICHICEKRVMLGPDATLDHLIPLADAGSHTYENVRLAHRSCNSRRGRGRIDAQLLLIG